MAEKSTFIKLDRNIQEWRWYQNANTFRVFIHLLLSANIAPKHFENIVLQRGELATSYDKIGQKLHLTTQEVRTAIKHLKLTGEITTKNYSKYQVIYINNYNIYQAKGGELTVNLTVNQQATNSQLTGNQQQLKNNKNIRIEEYKEQSIIPLHIEGGYNSTAPPPCGVFGNVFLSNEELESLKAGYPLDYQQMIDHLSTYMANTGKKYASHYATIIKWAKEDAEQQDGKSGKPKNNCSFDTDDFFQAAVNRSYKHKGVKEDEQDDT